MQQLPQASNAVIREKGHNLMEDVGRVWMMFKITQNIREQGAYNNKNQANSGSLN